MAKPRENASPVLDEAPTEDGLTDYDRQHLATYLMLLDAVDAGTRPDQIIRDVLQLDPVHDRERALRAFESHLARARWMARVGYQYLLNDEKLRLGGDAGTSRCGNDGDNFEG